MRAPAPRQTPEFALGFFAVRGLAVAGEAQQVVETAMDAQFEPAQAPTGNEIHALDQVAQGRADLCAIVSGQGRFELFRQGLAGGRGRGVQLDYGRHRGRGQSSLDFGAPDFQRPGESGQFLDVQRPGEVGLLAPSPSCVQANP